MTEAFAAETAHTISITDVPETHYGVTTRVITLDVTNMDELNGLASLTITTQREESIDSPQNISVRYQDVLLELVQVNSEWLVSSAKWQ